MKIVDCEQGTPEWRDARLGVPTASKFSEIITPARGNYSASGVHYMNRLIAEKVTGKEATGFTSDWMKRGVEMEAEARSWYNFTQGVEVQQVGFVYKDERKLLGCSPDGLVNGSKGFEVKCPSAGVMVGYMLEKELPGEHIPQVQGSLFVSGLDEWDFLAYHPEFKPMLITVQRDEPYISKLEMHLHRFNTEMAEKLERINNDTSGPV